MVNRPEVETAEQRTGKALAVAVPKFLAVMGERLGLEPKALHETVFKTCMYDDATAEEFRTFLVVAANLDLNPLAGEVYAFRKRGGGIQVIVGKEGFQTLTNRHPDYDGKRFYYYYQEGEKVEISEYPKEGYDLVMVECELWRKSRTRPEVAFAKHSEYFRKGIDTWEKYETTMLEHKAFLKAAKAAFGFAGAVDIDEAARYCDLKQIPEAARDEARTYALPAKTQTATETRPMKTEAPAPAEALASAKQINYIHGMSKENGLPTTDDLKAFLAWRKTPKETFTFAQASDLITQLENKDYSDISRFLKESLKGE